MTQTVLQVAEVIVGAGLVAYAAIAAARWAMTVKWHWRPLRSDLQVAAELADRLQRSGNEAALAACRAMIEALLKPQVPA